MNNRRSIQTLEERKESIVVHNHGHNQNIKCNSDSVSGSVSQRACVYCGARVVLNPITDAYHLVHGPIGCAAYTWDIRGSLSSGKEVYRNSFSTDLKEQDIIFGGEERLKKSIHEMVTAYDPEVIFIYATCVIGVIGDDLNAICKEAEQQYGITVIPVQSSGFAGNKSSGYKAACHTILKLMERTENIEKQWGINYLGDFNLAGELWIIKKYLKEIGIPIIASFTGDSSTKMLQQAPGAMLNIVQCAGSMTYLAKQMEERYGIPYLKISFCGIEDTIQSLRQIAKTVGEEKIIIQTEKWIQEQQEAIGEQLQYYREKLYGKKAAIYVGGGFKAISLIKQFKDLGIQTVMVGTQTGNPDEYEMIRQLAEEGTVILDDANPTELEKFMLEQGADILVGGVKERPLAYKLGVSFLDHNHERKHPLCGFEGAINFAKELDLTVNSPVWKHIKKEAQSLQNRNEVKQLRYLI